MSSPGWMSLLATRYRPHSGSAATLQGRHTCHALSIVQIVHLWDDLVLEVVGAVQRAAELRPALLAPHDRVNILQTVTAQVTQHHEGVISIKYLK